MPTYVTPGVYFEAVDASRLGIAAVRTDIAAFIGIAERGPLHLPLAVSTWKQFQSVFGGFIPNGYLAYAVKAFFENGGRTCYIVRVAANTAETQSDPAVTQPTDGSASIILSVDGFAPGAAVTVRQDPGVQTGYLLRDVDPATRRLIWSRPLGPEFSLNAPGKPLSFATGGCAASGVLLDSLAAPTLRIEANSPGTWGNGLAVHLSRSIPAATRTRPTPQPPDRTASQVETVTGFPAGSLVKAFQGQAPNTHEAYRVVAQADATRNLLTWDSPLDASFDVTSPISFEALEFGLSVYLNGQVSEIFSGLSLVPTHPRYVGVAITAATTQLITVTDLGSDSPWPARLPDPASPRLTKGVLPLRGGRDGVAALQPIDLIGDTAFEQKWGLRTLEDVDEVAIVAMPDALIQPRPPVETAPLSPPNPDPCLPSQQPIPFASPPAPRLVEAAPTFSVDQVYAMQQAMVDHCTSLRYRVALLEPPIVPGSTEPVDPNVVQSWRQRFDSTYAALYYPWLLVYDPLQLDGKVVRMMPPSGHVAGIIAHTDVTVGVHQAPANVALAWAQSVTTGVTAEIQGLLNPQGINCIRVFPGRGLRLYGARTVSSDPNWRYLNVRRLLLMIERAVELSLQWTAFEPNDAGLRQMLTLVISSFLTALWSRGMLNGATADEAFFVKCDAGNNPPAVTDVGQVIAEVGVAPVIPAEFVVFRVGRTENTLLMSEQVTR
jgi:phage tail sheath protein FI